MCSAYDDPTTYDQPRGVTPGDPILANHREIAGRMFTEWGPIMHYRLFGWHRGGYVAFINDGGVPLWIGHFETLDAAHDAAKEATR